MTARKDWLSVVLAVLCGAALLAVAVAG